MNALIKSSLLLLLLATQSMNGMNQNNKRELEEQETNNNDESNKQQKNICNQHSNLKSAVILSCLDCCKRLVEVNSTIENDLEIRGQWLGETLFHQACGIGKKSIIKLLIKNGANLEAVDNRAATPLASPINCFEYHNDISIIELLIEKGASIITSDIYGNTPLHSACQRNSTELIKLLFTHKADFNKTNKKNKKPLTQNGCSQEFREKVCAYIRSFKQPILTFLLFVKRIKNEKKVFIPKVLQRLILRLILPLGLHEGTNGIANIEQRITEWTTDNENNENK